VTIDAADTLIDYALAVEWAALPADAQQAARTFLHDTLCVGIAGRNAANSDAVCTAALGWGGAGGTSAVLGRPGVTSSAPYAAFINAFQIHAQEYDCVHEGAVAHPLATVVAALLAEATRSGPYAGADFLAAMVAGVGIVATLGTAVKGPLKFFRPATAGIFASVAALARLRRMDRATARNAMGFALAYTSGTMQAHVEGTPALALQVAGAARSAVEAIDLAAAGLTGPHRSIEGPFGYFALFESGVDLPPALAHLQAGQPITELSWKPFPTGRAAQGAIVALQMLMRTHDFGSSDLDHFLYRAPPLIARLVGRRPIVGMTPAYARLCLAYLGAVTLRRGSVTLEDFDRAALDDPETLALAERLVVEADGNPDLAAFVPAVATAVLRDGRVLNQHVARQFGAPEWPLSKAEHFAKANACLRFGDLASAAEALAIVYESFEDAHDVAIALAPAFGGASAMRAR
jgi:2-methylcitrate dehydratase PrpD